jgi:hypothetical protein
MAPPTPDIPSTGVTILFVNMTLSNPQHRRTVFSEKILKNRIIVHAEKK